jgi:hypothetical protein
VIQGGVNGMVVAPEDLEATPAADSRLPAGGTAARSGDAPRSAATRCEPELTGARAQRYAHRWVLR